jgi:Ca-activated chloride channel family protein
VLQAVSKGSSLRLLAACGSVCILILFFVLAGFAQPPQAEARGEANRTALKILVHSDLVLIPVTVTDNKGRVQPGLEKEHFTLYEDRVEQEITHFAAEDAPVSIGLIFDISDSMGPKMPKAREAVSALLRRANPDDEFFLIEFNQRPRLVVPLTSHSADVERRVAMINVNGSTAVLDAVAMGLREMKNARHTRKAMILISDGEDNSSHISVGELKGAVGESDVLIYAIGISDSNSFGQSWPRARLTGAPLLNEIAKQTGGCLFEVDKLKQLPEVATKIGTWLRSQYVLGYSPKNPDSSGGYHRVDVKITRPKGMPKVHAAWRLGYYAPTQ